MERGGMGDAFRLAPVVGAANLGEDLLEPRVGGLKIGNAPGELVALGCNRVAMREARGLRAPGPRAGDHPVYLFLRHARAPNSR